MTNRTQPTPFPVSRQRQKAIGEELARMYAKTLAEPPPQHFLDLLEKLDQPAPSKEAAK